MEHGAISAVVRQIFACVVEELSVALNELTDYLDWLVSRGDLEAADKAQPIVERILGVMAAIAEAEDPEFGKVLDSLKEARSETNALLRQAKSPEEIAFIVQQSREFCETLNKIVREYQSKKKLDS